MKDKKIQEKEKINMQLLNKKKQKLKENGITLIALVVTIIILLILAGVTLNMALSGDGLFSRARNAADKYKKAQEDEQKLISEIGKEMNSEYVGAYVIGYEPTKKTEENPFKIESSKTGVSKSDTEDLQYTTIDNIDEDGTQKFTTDAKIKWRIWDYDGTILRIILETPTKQKLTLKGAIGYNNGVNLINEICRQCYGEFGVDEKMKQGISVANLRRSDIQKVSTYDYTKYEEKENLSTEGEDNTLKFGETKIYTENLMFPKIWGDNDRNWSYKYEDEKYDGEDKECLIWEKEIEMNNKAESEKATEKLETKGSYYNHTYKISEFINQKYFDLIFSMENLDDDEFKDYYLAGRSVNFGNNFAQFCLNKVEPYGEKNKVAGYDYFRSYENNGNNRVGYCRLRPIVSINLKTSGYSLRKEGEKYSLSKDE